MREGRRSEGAKKRFKILNFLAVRELRGSVLVPSVALPDLVPYSFAIKKKVRKLHDYFVSFKVLGHRLK